MVDYWSMQEEVSSVPIAGGEGPLEDIVTRSKMAFLGDTLSEKEKVFRSSYPEGELRLSPSTNKLQFKTNVEADWSNVDLPFTRSLGDGGEFLTDVSEFIAGSPEIIPEILATFKTRGLSLIPLMADPRCNRGWK